MFESQALHVHQHYNLLISYTKLPKRKRKKCSQFQTLQCTKISRKSTTKFKQESSVSSSSVQQPYIRSITLKFYCYMCNFFFFHTFAARCLARDIPYSPKYALNFTMSSLLTEESNPVKNNNTKNLNAFDFVYEGQYKFLTNCPDTRCKTITLFECQCIQHKDTNNQGHYFYVPSRRPDHHIMWPSEPHKGLAVCRVQAVPLIHFSSILDPELWYSPKN